MSLIAIKSMDPRRGSPHDAAGGGDDKKSAGAGLSKFIVRGGKPLHGTVRLAGSKNAASKMMVASLLTDEPCTFTNVPDIEEVAITEELCRTIGSEISRKDHAFTICTPRIASSCVIELTRRNRIPILALGPLLARAGEAEVPILGGDKIGHRPVDLHLKSLEAMGAEITLLPKSYRAVAPKGLHGAMIRMHFPSVGATENVILAAVLAKGNTVILNAALEPEIMSLVKMLQKMGAIIELGANRDIYIEGVKKLRGVEHEVIPDRNEAVSFACLAIATGGKILVEGALQDHLITFLNVVRRLGAEYEVKKEGIVFSRPNILKPLHIETGVHPGFMTDWQQPLAVVLTQAEGDSMIHETIYEDRFGYAKDLNSIGAKIEVFADCPDESWCRFAGKKFGHVALIHGPTKLHGGGKFHVRDLRSGIVDAIAALVADGETEISGIEEIDRGYENIDERLRNLGAEIKRSS